MLHTKSLGKVFNRGLLGTFKCLQIAEYTTRKRVYLHIPNAARRLARERGARWDFERQQWFAFDGSAELESCKEWYRHYLPLPEPQSDKIIPLKGARWDHALSKWFVTGSATYNAIDWSIPFVSPAVEGPVVAQAPVIPDKIEPHHKVLIFDLETNGLPNSSKPPGDPSRYDTSRVVQASFMLCNCLDLAPCAGVSPEDAVGDVIVQSDGFPISNHSIHGITEERSQREGLPFREAIRRMAPQLLEAQYILAHNAAFDVPVLRAELQRYGEEDLIRHLDSMKVVCSMLRSAPILQIAGRHSAAFKNPSMKELYNFATSSAIERQHDARWDVINLHRALQRLLEKRVFEVDMFFNGPAEGLYK